MGWLAERTDQRSHPQSLWPAANTVIALGLAYTPDGDPLATIARPDRGNISVYARNRDYHDVLKGMLKHLAQFIAARFHAEVKVFVDTAPVMEKPLAQQAGIGWQGKHTNLVSRAHGSWLFLGEIYTTLEIPPDEPHPDRCGTCTACLTACPTNAFPTPYRLDATRCISYLTIEHPGPIPEEFRPAIGNRIYGCDDCLAACPWNRFAREGRLMKPHARKELATPDLLELLQLDDAGFKARFAGTPMLRTKRRGLLRNVCVALGNTGDASALPALERATHDQEPLIAEHARWAIENIRSLSTSTKHVSNLRPSPYASS
jgi:epoxyqueuosine reductase